MSQNVEQPEEQTGLARQLLQGGVGSAITKGLSLALSLAVSVILARALGPREFGLYSFVFALASIMAVPSQFGLPGLILRETGRALGKRDYGRLLGSWHWSSRIAIFASGVVAILGILATLLLGYRVPALRSAAYYWSLLLVPFVSLGAVRGAALRGLGKIVQGLLPELILVPALLSLFIGGLWLYQPFMLSADTAMAAHAAAAGIAFVIGIILLYGSRPPALRAGVLPIYERESWRRSVIPMAAIMGVTIVIKHTDVVMVGLLTTDERVGVYRVAAQWSWVVTLGVQIVGFVIPPYFARFHAAGDNARLQKLATQSASVSSLLGLPPLLGFVLFGKPLIGLIFGPAYLDAYLPLVILATGQYMSALLGSCDILLAMADFEHNSAKIMALSALANIAFNAVLIPIWGLIGAAVACSLAVLLQRIVLWRVAWLRLGIDTAAFSRVSR